MSAADATSYLGGYCYVQPSPEPPVGFVLGIDILPVVTAEDRSVAVPPGCIIRTGYVHIDHVRMACRERMAIGDVDRAYQRQLQLGAHQRWPCPRGLWEGDFFRVYDGRHSVVAAIMHGIEWLLVAWVEPTAA